MLAEVSDWFTEGLDTATLQEVSTLLVKLGERKRERAVRLFRTGG
jgi:hypothetical protein